MRSIRGIYTGEEIKPLEVIHVRPNVHVIITFLDDVPGETEAVCKVEQEKTFSSKSSTQIFLEKCEGWEDTRSPEEIIAEIYESRTTSERGTRFFQENT